MLFCYPGNHLAFGTPGNRTGDGRTKLVLAPPPHIAKSQTPAANVSGPGNGSPQPYFPLVAQATVSWLLALPAAAKLAIDTLASIELAAKKHPPGLMQFTPY